MFVDLESVGGKSQFLLASRSSITKGKICCAITRIWGIRGAGTNARLSSGP
jgi:hypothetical protein